MKEEKYFGGLLKRKVPEKEWEGKYLNDLQKIGDYGTLMLIGIIMFGSAAVLFAVSPIATTTCSMEMEGDYTGEIKIDERELKIDWLERLEINSVGGKVKVEFPCTLLAQGYSSYNNRL